MSISSIVKNRWGQRGPVSGVRIGTTGAGTRAFHYTSDGKNFVTKLVVDGVMPAIVGGTNLSVGLLVFTFPAGVHSLKVVRMSIGLTQSEGNVNSDTPKIGIGDIIGVGAVTDLTGTAGFDNILTEQTANNCTGTVEEKTLVMPTAGHIVNESAGVKDVWINVADGWAASGDAALGVAGEVWLEWTRFTGS